MAYRHQGGAGSAAAGPVSRRVDRAGPRHHPVIWVWIKPIHETLPHLGPLPRVRQRVTARRLTRNHPPGVDSAGSQTHTAVTVAYAFVEINVGGLMSRSFCKAVALMITFAVIPVAPTA